MSDLEEQRPVYVFYDNRLLHKLADLLLDNCTIQMATDYSANEKILFLNESASPLKQ
jgi:hypothetical protein